MTRTFPTLAVTAVVVAVAAAALSIPRSGAAAGAGAAPAAGTARAAPAMPSLPPVIAVRPSGPQVPANLLRISIRFATPPEGPVLRRLSLVDRDGARLPEPFLDQELWSPDGRTLTVLLHPGRVKTGLIAHEQLGGILAEGDTVGLRLDRGELRRWQVGARDERGPRPRAWRPSALQVGRRDALEVTLDAPIDALDVGYLAVIDAADRPVEGRAALNEGETVWRFTPDRVWPAGPFRLIVRATLEDPSGNRMDGTFEQPLDADASPAQDAVLTLQVRDARPPHRSSHSKAPAQAAHAAPRP
ncbi:MAG: hypothetical protein J7598_10540 [Mitsuaria chitosanitabida]|uniref:hypothetical protein n=1 Tax=Roseateles chitosanitabidus TaxID=65048 RepID=UPI001B2E0132|nr:hypothetical protein [Roseateles chitosanitabidus]MBO9687042.1 hypothetical protein [Roseateles chitosanitabidus]